LHARRVDDGYFDQWVGAARLPLAHAGGLGIQNKNPELLGEFALQRGWLCDYVGVGMQKVTIHTVD
jgi:hypothetical protein